MMEWQHHPVPDPKYWRHESWWTPDSSKSDIRWYVFYLETGIYPWWSDYSQAYITIKFEGWYYAPIRWPEKGIKTQGDIVGPFKTSAEAKDAWESAHKNNYSR